MHDISKAKTSCLLAKIQHLPQMMIHFKDMEIKDQHCSFTAVVYHHD